MLRAAAAVGLGCLGRRCCWVGGMAPGHSTSKLTEAESHVGLLRVSHGKYSSLVGDRRPAAGAVASAPSRDLCNKTGQSTGETIQILVTLPAGVNPGQQIDVQAPDGRRVRLTVPAETVAGDQLQVQLPALPVPAAAEHSAGMGGEGALLVFARAHPALILSKGGAEVSVGTGGPPWRAACSAQVMRTGRHFAQFTVIRQRMAMHFGLVKQATLPARGFNVRMYAVDLTVAYCTWCTGTAGLDH
jgi:hypothetical protein